MCIRDSLRRQLAGLEQDVIGDAHFADVVQGRRLDEALEILLGQKPGKPGMIHQMIRQHPDIALGAAQVVAGLRIADFRQMGQRPDADILDQQVFFLSLIHI